MGVVAGCGAKGNDERSTQASIEQGVRHPLLHTALVHVTCRYANLNPHANAPLWRIYTTRGLHLAKHYAPSAVSWGTLIAICLCFIYSSFTLYCVPSEASAS